MRSFLAFALLTLSACAVREPGDGATDSVGGGYSVGTPTAGTGSTSDDNADVDDDDDDQDDDTDTDTGTDDTDSGTTDTSTDDSGNADTATDDTSSDTGADAEVYHMLYVGWTSNVSGSVDVYAVNLSCPSWSGYCVEGQEVTSGTGSATFDLADLGCDFEWGDELVVQGAWAGGTRWLEESSSYADSGDHINAVVIGEYYESDDTLSITVSDLDDTAYRVDHKSDPGADYYVPTPDDPRE